MKKYIVLIISLIWILFLNTGCELVAEIFEAGFWLGIIVAAIVVFAIVWLIVKGIQKFK